jgi:hypothetical protein
VLLFEVRRNYTTLQPWPFELRCKPPTLSSTASFGSGSWYTEKDPARAIPFKTFRCDVEAVVAFREVRRNYTTLQPWPFELRCKPPTLSTTSFGSGSWYTTEKDPAEPYHSRPFVVMLRRSFVAFREVRRNYHSSTMAVRVTCKPPTLSSTASFGSGSWYTTEKDPARAYLSRPFVVMLRRSLCCFSEVSETYPLFNHGRSSYGAPPTLSSTKLRFR